MGDGFVLKKFEKKTPPNTKKERKRKKGTRVEAYVVKVSDGIV